MTDTPSLKPALISDISAAFSLLTHLPIPVDHELAGKRAAYATWAYPLVGASLGLLAGLIGCTLYWFGAPSHIAALVSLISLVIFSGGLHEDGLADCADGFGGAYEKNHRLEIMKDSRIGAFGAIALILLLIGRTETMGALISNAFIPALIAVGATSRLTMVLAMYAMTNARGSGLASTVGKPPETSLIIAIITTLLLCFLMIGWSGIFVFGWAIIAASVMGFIAYRSIGGYTGDVLGAMQQCAELAALAAAITAFG